MTNFMTILLLVIMSIIVISQVLQPSASSGGLEFCITKTEECVDLWEIEQRVTNLENLP